LRICNYCKIHKEFSEFHKDKSKKNGVITICKVCISIKSKEYRLKNKDAIRNKKVKYHSEHSDEICRKSKEWYENNKDKASATARSYRLKNKYGLSKEDYFLLGEKQDWKCAICGSKESRNKNSTNLSVDHSHITGKVRGLLCHPCNAGIGYLQEDIKIMKNSIKYLEGFSHE
jgi:hypothetical protein